MLLHSLFVMMKLSGLYAHAIHMLMHIKTNLGYTWMTMSKAEDLKRLFSVLVVGHNVRRRMGKSIAVCSDLARSICLFPEAGIMGLYTVHLARAAETCFSVVSSASKEFIELFNLKQKSRFQKRIAARHTYIDPEDYYFRAALYVRKTNREIQVDFERVRHEQAKQKVELYSKNTLTFIGYTQENVRVFLFHLLHLFLSCSLSLSPSL